MCTHHLCVARTFFGKSQVRACTCIYVNLLDLPKPRKILVVCTHEQVGPAGIGKSQMCFQLALLCAAPSEVGGLEAATMYVDTEHKFSPQRSVHARAHAFVHAWHFVCVVFARAT